MENAHSLPAAAVLQRFGVQESCGLSPEQVAGLGVSEGWGYREKEVGGRG
uniref:Uncharacterized protein n=1 Tax=Chelonoidis abingdonii TaxID=106734 RepID=A0A8C0H3E5_CHEAB